jgi:hypothetical protein
MTSRVVGLVALSMFVGGAISATSGVAAQAQAQENVARVKGVYRDAQKPGVKVSVFKGSGASRSRVSSDYEFQSGDPFELELETNQAVYVYVLNRTLPGDPSTLKNKGIDRIRDDDQRAPAQQRMKYKMLYPRENDPKTTKVNTPFKIPGLSMDDTPGVEKMFIVLSAKPVNLANYFDLTNGNQRGGGGGGGTGGGRRVDTADDVLSQLNKDLVLWQGNSDITLGKGVQRDTDNIGVIQDPTKPGMLELTLQHHPRRAR